MSARKSRVFCNAVNALRNCRGDIAEQNMHVSLSSTWTASVSTPVAHPPARRKQTAAIALERTTARTSPRMVLPVRAFLLSEYHLTARRATPGSAKPELSFGRYLFSLVSHALSPGGAVKSDAKSSSALRCA